MEMDVPVNALSRLCGTVSIPPMKNQCAIEPIFLLFAGTRSWDTWKHVMMETLSLEMVAAANVKRNLATFVLTLVCPALNSAAMDESMIMSSAMMQTQKVGMVVVQAVR